MDVAVTDVAYQRPVRRWKPERCDRIALVLQGGGALGAYQAGVFQALSEADIEPDWVTGVSIGAINSAIIAGNEGHAKDYEFSGTSMREHWQSGYEDTKRTLKKQEWLRMPVEGAGIVVHDVHRESDR